MTVLRNRTAAFAIALAAVATGSLAVAAPAMASDPTPAQAKMLLQPSDLPSSYGKATDGSFQNVQAGGVLASLCATPDFQAVNTSVKDSQSMFSNVDLSTGETWAQSIFTYPSKATARKAYNQLVKRSVAECKGTDSTTKGDDNVTIPKRTTVVNTSVANGILTSASSSTSKGGGKAPYADNYTRIVAVLNGNAIESLAIFGAKPISASKAAKQDEILSNLVGQYKG